MRKLAYLTFAATALAFSVSPAFAQSEDESWEGAYIGGSFGLGAQSNDGGESVVFDTNLDGQYGDTVRTSAGADAFTPGFCNGAASSSANTDCRGDRDDFEYYLRAGYDAQNGNIVYGFLLDGGRSQSRDSVTAFSSTPASYTLTRKLDYSIGARGRVGYAARGALFYVTGGAAYAKIKNGFTTSNGVNSFATNGKTESWGWTAGGGTEVKIARNLSLGLEYLYSNYVDDDFVVGVGRGTAPATNPFLLVNANGTNLRRSDSDFDQHNIRITAAIRF